MNKIVISIFFFLQFSSQMANAQLEGDQWVLGYWSNGNPEYSIMNMDFRSGEMKLNWLPEIVFKIIETQANICDSDGEPILWTNGLEIMGKGGIEIADTIANDGDPLGYWNYFYLGPRPFGFPKLDGALILPVPEKENEYSVLYHSAELHPLNYFQLTKHLEARIVYDGVSTFDLLYQDRLIGNRHEWYAGPIEAIRHANGKDWWIIAFEENSPTYYSFLLDAKGIKLHHEGNVDMIIKDGLGQAAFSNQGNYMARMDAVTFDEGQFITLYSFDRCLGDLERLETFHTTAGYFTGVAFSPSERFLYADDNTYLWQWDLWADDIAASQTLVDSFDGFVQPGWFQMRFGPMMTAPDGKIYVVPSAGSSEFMHVIERPDLPADECKFLQHHINLTVPNGRTAPNIPNFRLGPLDGSPCDTLGLDNHPVARWRYEQDQIDDWKTILFTDLSYYDPEIWHWDFGDGATSAEISPVHTFDPGLYHVCLTVSNSNASDSTCKWIEILTTSTEDDDKPQGSDLSISPNPFTETLEIHSQKGNIRKVHLQIYYMHGRKVLDEKNAPVPVSIQLPSLSPGMYLCVIREKDGTVFNAKVMKM